MPRRLFRRFLPDEDTIRANRYLARVDARWLHHPNLWHLNRRSVAGGFAIGLFAGLVPGPLQMLVAALLAIPLRKNLPVALITTFYTNPFTIVPLYVLAVAYGRLLLGVGHHPVHVEAFEWDWSHWMDSMQGLVHWMVSLGKPFALGLPALAFTLAALGYCVALVGWRAHTIIKWRARARHRATTM